MNMVLVILSVIAVGAFLGGGGFLGMVYFDNIGVEHRFGCIVLGLLGCIVYTMTAVIGGFYIQANNLMNNGDFDGYVIGGIVSVALYIGAVVVVARES